MRRWLVCAGAALLAASPAFAQDTCPAARLPILSLPKVRQALATNQEITIVAFGSSSTAGAHSSDIAHSYPAVLQAELAAALPNAHIAVLNRGIGGQDVQEMLPRIERDVLAIQPTLVIWQVGANGAMRKMPPEQFHELVSGGVRRLRTAGVDLILMDNQRAPAIMASPEHMRIARALADVAARFGAGLFGRGDLMDQWRTAGHPYERFISADGIHHNDLGYRCVGVALAAAIKATITQPLMATVPDVIANTTTAKR